MRLRLAWLSLKLRASKFAYLLFCVLLAYASQLAIGNASSKILGINLGFVVWILASGYFLVIISAQRERAESMSNDNDSFYDLLEFKMFIEQLSDRVLKLKYIRFIKALEDVMKQSGISLKSFPGVFISTPKTDIKEAEEAKLMIYHTGLDKGSVIGVSAESIFADDVTQDTMSYILAHELGHFLSNSILNMALIDSIGQIAKTIFRYIFGGLFVYYLFTGEWQTAISAILINIGLLTLMGIIRNTMIRYEEYYADSYAVSLGFGEAGINFFDHMIKNKISLFPEFLEIIVDHPSHQNRRKNNQNLHQNNEGAVPDALEQIAYTLLAVFLAAALYFVTPSSEVVGVLLAYFWFLGLCISIATPNFVAPSLLQKSIKFTNWALSIGVLVTVVIPLGLIAEVSLTYFFLNTALFFRQLFLTKSNYFKAISDHVEVGLAVIALLLLSQALHFLNIPLLLQTSLF